MVEQEFSTRIEEQSDNPFFAKPEPCFGLFSSLPRIVAGAERFRVVGFTKTPELF